MMMTYRTLSDQLADILRDIYNDNTWEPEDEWAELEAAFTERVADLTHDLSSMDTQVAYAEATYLLNDLAAHPIEWAR